MQDCSTTCVYVIKMSPQALLYTMLSRIKAEMLYLEYSTYLVQSTCYYTVRREAIYTKFMNSDVLEVFPRDARHLFYAAETFTEQVVQVNIKTQHTQPFLHAHLHNRITHTYTMSHKYVFHRTMMLYHKMTKRQTSKENLGLIYRILY